MSGDSVRTGAIPTDPASVPLVGRVRELEQVLAWIEQKPGMLVLHGDSGVGLTRLAHEALRGVDAVAVTADDDGSQQIGERVRCALARAGLPEDPVEAAARTPFVVFVDDIAPDDQHASEALGRALRGSDGCVLACARHTPRWAVALRVAPLDRSEIEAIVRHAVPEIEGGLCQRIGALADGSPDVALALAYESDPASDEVTIPELLVHKLLRNVGAAALSVADWIALAGVVDSDWIAAASGLSVVDVEAHVDELIRVGLVARTTSGTSVFERRVVGVALNARWGERARRRAHAGLAVSGRELERPWHLVIDHAERSGNRELHVSVLVAAANEAWARNDDLNGLSYAEAALERWTPSAGVALRADAFLIQARCHVSLGSWDTASRFFERASGLFRTIDDMDAAYTAATAGAAADWTRGRATLGSTRLKRVIDRDQTGVTTPARVRALRMVATMSATSGNYSAALDWAVRLRSEARRCGDDSTARFGLALFGFARIHLSGDPSSLIYVERALTAAAEADDARQMDQLRPMLSSLLRLVGKVERSVAVASQGAAHVEALGGDLAMALSTFAEAKAWAGDLVEARDLLARTAAVAAEVGAESPAPWDPGICWVHTMTGDFAAARQVAELTIDRPDGRVPHFQDVLLLVAARALAAFESGEKEHAADAVARGLHELASRTDRLAAVPLLEVGALAGTDAESNRCYRQLIESARCGNLFAQAVLPAAAGHLRARANDSSCVDAYRLAASRCEALGLRWFAARFLFDAGRTSAPGAAGDEALRAARQLFSAMGAEGWRRSAEAQLRRRGRRISSRATPATTLAGLSGREVEVLRFVAEGMTNREIGASLVISEHTVARHVASALRKLGVRTRGAAAAAVTSALVGPPADQSTD